MEFELEDDVKQLLTGEEKNTQNLKEEVSKNLELNQEKVLEFLHQIKSKKKQLLTEIDFLENRYDEFLKDIDVVFDSLNSADNIRSLGLFWEFLLLVIGESFGVFLLVIC